jgi:hypothetical protein
MEQTVKEWVASNVTYGGTIEFDEQIRTYADKKIIKHFDGTELAFPQNSYTYRNVMNWVLLEDGTSVGWNESPRSGWSFPRSSKKVTKRYLEYYKLNEKGEPNA